MVTWLDCGEVVSGSESKHMRNGLYIAFSYFDPIPFTMDTMVKGRMFKPLRWKECLHMKASGIATPYGNCDIFAGELPKRATSTDWQISNGIIAADGTFIFDARKPGMAWKITSSAVTYVVAINDRRGRHWICHQGSRYRRRSPSGAYVDSWFMRSRSSQGFRFGETPVSGFLPNYPSEWPSAESLVRAWLDVSYYDVQSQWLYWAGEIRATYRLANSGATLQDCKAAIRHYRSLMSEAVNDDFYAKLPELQAKSFDQVNKFDGNMLAFCSELNDFGKTIPSSLAELIRSAGTSKDLARFWLSSRYGDRLSFGDFADLIRALDSTVFAVTPKSERFVLGQTRQALTVSFGDMRGSSVASGYYACRVAVSPKDDNTLMRMIRNAYEWDYYPTLGNVWDMIPLSFVVDWFVNVSDIFESIDRMIQSRYYNVECILQTAKAEGACPGFPGVKLSFYDRTLSYSLNLGVSSVRLGLPSAINVVDGISLLLS